PYARISPAKRGSQGTAQPDARDSADTVGEGEPRAEFASSHMMLPDKEDRDPPHYIDHDIGQSLRDGQMTQAAPPPKCREDQSQRRPALTLGARCLAAWRIPHSGSHEERQKYSRRSRDHENPTPAIKLVDPAAHEVAEETGNRDRQSEIRQCSCAVFIAFVVADHGHRHRGET